jgi:DNA invertase Pin-like site-specific DNA recombinase
VSPVSCEKYRFPRGKNLIRWYKKFCGKRSNNRPQLAAALAACKKQRAKLVIAKLDRLARNVHFISGLMDAGVEFVACDMPHANKLTIHILAAVAEHEREMISTRTKVALAAAKARGQKLGGPKLDEARILGRAALSENADRFAANTLPIVKQIQGTGITTLHGIAAALAARGVPTARGGNWTPVQVSNLMRRVILRIDLKPAPDAWARSITASCTARKPPS